MVSLLLCDSGAGFRLQIVRLLDAQYSRKPMEGQYSEASPVGWLAGMCSRSLVGPYLLEY